MNCPQNAGDGSPLGSVSTVAVCRVRSTSAESCATKANCHCRLRSPLAADNPHVQGGPTITNTWSRVPGPIHRCPCAASGAHASGAAALVALWQNLANPPATAESPRLKPTVQMRREGHGARPRRQRCEAAPLKRGPGARRCQVSAGDAHSWPLDWKGGADGEQRRAGHCGQGFG